MINTDVFFFFFYFFFIHLGARFEAEKKNSACYKRMDERHAC